MITVVISGKDKHVINKQEGELKKNWDWAQQKVILCKDYNILRKQTDKVWLQLHF